MQGSTFHFAFLIRFVSNSRVRTRDHSRSFKVFRGHAHDLNDHRGLYLESCLL